MGKNYLMSLLAALLLLAAGAARGQNIINDVRNRVDQVKKADPLVLSGQLGASISSNYSSLDNTASPFATSTYANITLSVYGFSIPLSMNLLSISASQFSFPKPRLTLGATPTWKRLRFHLGYSSMHFSNYTYSGMQFLGVGMEYTGKVARAGAFYGTLNRPTKFKMYDNRSAIRRYADSLLGLNLPESTTPQYKRKAYGLKLGLGGARNYVDISVLKALDDLNSLPEYWIYTGDTNMMRRDSVVKAKENLAVGLSGRISVRDWLAFTTNIGLSVYTPDISSDTLSLTDMAGLINDTSAMWGKAQQALDKMAWLYTLRPNTIARAAGDAALMLHFPRFSTTLSYRFIQPDYVSLGASTFTQNTHSLGWVNDMTLFKGRSHINLSLYGQRDNLNGQQLYTNQVVSSNLAWNTMFGDHLGIDVAYSGIKQDQMDGTMAFNDSTEAMRINQMTQTLALTPIVIFGEETQQNVTVSFNYSGNANRNPLGDTTADASTISLGLGYGNTPAAFPLTWSAMYDYSRSNSSYSKYSTHAINLSASYPLKQHELLTWTLTYSGSLGFNKVQEQGDYQNIKHAVGTYWGYGTYLKAAETKPVGTFSFSNNLGTSLHSKLGHTLTAFLTLTNYSEYVILAQKVTTALDFRFTASYSYSFGRKLIERKKKPAEDGPMLESETQDDEQAKSKK